MSWQVWLTAFDRFSFGLFFFKVKFTIWIELLQRNIHRIQCWDRRYVSSLCFAHETNKQRKKKTTATTIISLHSDGQSRQKILNSNSNSNTELRVSCVCTCVFLFCSVMFFFYFFILMLIIIFLFLWKGSSRRCCYCYCCCRCCHAIIGLFIGFFSVCVYLSFFSFKKKNNNKTRRKKRLLRLSGIYRYYSYGDTRPVPNQCSFCYHNHKLTLSFPLCFVSLSHSLAHTRVINFYFSYSPKFFSFSFFFIVLRRSLSVQTK